MVPGKIERVAQTARSFVFHDDARRGLLSAAGC